MSKSVTKGVPAMLEEIASEINHRVDTTVQTVVEAKLEIGKLLLEAREFFPGDKEFGEWREEHTHIKSRQEATACMRIATLAPQIEPLIKACNWSSLRELSYAPPAAIKQIEQIVAETGTAPSARDTRAVVREHVADAPKRVADTGTTDTRPKVGGVMVPREKTAEEKSAAHTQLDIEDRIEVVDVYDDIGYSLLVFGLDPFGSYHINKGTINDLAECLRQQYPEQSEIIERSRLTLIKAQ